MKSNYLFIFILAPFFLLSCAENSNESSSKNKTKTNIKTLTVAQLEYEIKAQLGEGAFWNYKTRELYWVDIEEMKLHIYDPTAKANRTLHLPYRIGTVVPQTDTTAVVALEDGIYIINTKNGNLQSLSAVERLLTGNRFNDGKCDPNGNLWVGSMHLEEKSPMGSVYKISPSGETTKMIDSVTVSNGIAWIEDASTMYYIDTPTRKIRAYDFDKATSTISSERVAVTVPDDVGYPDGMAIDEEGMLWVGMWNGDAVVRFNPKSGKIISKIEVPAHNVTSCAFGGDNLDKLYITTASIQMTEEEQEKYPLAGSLFIADPGVKGVQSKFFSPKTE